MEVIKKQPPIVTPPATYDLIGLTQHEANVLMTIVRNTGGAVGLPVATKFIDALYAAGVRHIAYKISTTGCGLYIDG